MRVNQLFGNTSERNRLFLVASNHAKGLAVFSDYDISPEIRQRFGADTFGQIATCDDERDTLTRSAKHVVGYSEIHGAVPVGVSEASPHVRTSTRIWALFAEAAPCIEHQVTGVQHVLHAAYIPFYRAEKILYRIVAFLEHIVNERNIFMVEMPYTNAVTQIHLMGHTRVVDLSEETVGDNITVTAAVYLHSVSVSCWMVSPIQVLTLNGTAYPFEHAVAHGQALVGDHPGGYAMSAAVSNGDVVDRYATVCTNGESVAFFAELYRPKPFARIHLAEKVEVARSLVIVPETQVAVEIVPALERAACRIVVSTPRLLVGTDQHLHSMRGTTVED